MVMLRRLGQLNARITQWGCMLAGGLVAVMLVIVMVQVLLRYGFSSSLSWSEEVSKSLMVWSTFLVAPWTYRKGSNVSIEVMQQQLSPVFRSFLQIILNMLVFWLMGVLLLESFYFVQRGWTINAASLPITMGWIYISIPISLLAMCLVSVELTLLEMRDFCMALTRGHRKGNS